MRNKIIILGRSPFINKIDFNKIDYDDYSICCINTINPQLKRVDYVVSTDYYINFPLNADFEWVSPQTGWLFKDSEDDYIIQEKILSWRFFSSSIAVSLAILRKYKKIYLAGVDLVAGKPIIHYDDNCIGNKPLSEKMCDSEKDFIKNICYKYNVEVFTLNIDNNWVSFADIGILK